MGNKNALLLKSKKVTNNEYMNKLIDQTFVCIFLQGKKPTHPASLASL